MTILENINAKKARIGQIEDRIEILDRERCELELQKNSLEKEVRCLAVSLKSQSSMSCGAVVVDSSYVVVRKIR